ncbi:MAG: hypothetical protein JXR48_06080 [Candidatus Delongbacteria bacterium]|nr:hypothetical protein [Candidatus Delongbacteria bacterium]MBN2834519.1 hypothetical protein [Candidatus Delongbacteria bacterium]
MRFFLIIIFSFQLLALDNYICEKVYLNGNRSFEGIRDVESDSDGYIWFGSNNGLFRYDGYDFKKYDYNPTDSNSISFTSISDLFVDYNRSLWVSGNSPDIMRYNKKSDNFENYLSVTEDERVSKFIITNSNTLLSSTSTELSLYDKLKNKYLGFRSHNSTFDKTLYNLIESGKTIAEIVEVKNNCDSTMSFTIEDEQYVMIASVGESSNGHLFDYGVILKNGKEIWKMNYYDSGFAGGDRRNKISFNIMKMEPGKYELCYISDETNSTEGWNIDKPDAVDFYGIKIISIEKSEKEKYLELISNTLSTRQNELNISCLENLNNENVLIASSRGIDILNLIDSKIENIPINFNNNGNLRVPVNDILISDDNNILYFATSDGLLKYYYDIKEVEYIDLSEGKDLLLESNIVSSLDIDSHGKIWCATLDGIICYDPATKAIERIRKEYYPNMYSNDIVKIFIDKSDNVWSITKTGLNKITKNRFRGKSYKFKVRYTTVIKDRVFSLSDRNEINVFDEQFNLIETLDSRLFQKSGEIYSLNHFRNKLLISGRDGNCIYDPDNSNTTIIPGEPILFNTFVEILTDKILIRTYEGKLLFYNLEDGVQIPLDKFELSDAFRTSGSIHYDKNRGKLYTVDRKYIYIFDLDFNLLKKIKYKDLRTIIYVYYVFNIEQDLNREEKIWFGSDQGLYCFDKNNFEIEQWNSSNGIESTIIYDLTDYDDNIYFSTQNGLCRLDKASNIIQSYFMEDGLYANEFKPFNSGRLHNNLFFSGQNWVIYFNPVEKNKYGPKSVLTNIRSFNEEGKFIHIPDTDTTIVLDYDKNNLELEFSALDFTNPSRNTFSYMMEGADKFWTYTDYSRRKVIFSNLSDGNYTFILNSANNDGIWNKNITKYNFVVKKPFWKEFWFIFSSIVIFFSSLLAVYKIRTRQIKKRNEELAYLISIRTADLEEANEEIEFQNQNLIEINSKIEEQNKELNDKNESLRVLNATKDKFFNIIAHDLRNPLTTIMGFSEILTDNYGMLNEDKKLRFLTNIHESTIAVHKLLENLLEWSRNQTGQIKFNPSIITFNEIISLITPLIKEKAESKNISIEYEYINDIEIFADINMMQTILRNLISNSLKFTPRGGIVSVGCRNEHNLSIIFVKDTGVGIDPEVKERLFSIDSNRSTRGTEDEGGTGLGLILVSDFIRRHDGTIKIYDNKPRGTEFRITLKRPS